MVGATLRLSLWLAQLPLFIAPGTVLFLLGTFVVSWLAAGPQYLGGIGLDTRAQLFGVLLVSFGLQIASIGVFASRVQLLRTLAPAETDDRGFFKGLKLEEGLAFGAVLMAIGLVGDATLVIPWMIDGFTILRGVRWVIFWSFWVVLGLQVCFASFFLSMIGISHGTWVGRPSQGEEDDE